MANNTIRINTQVGNDSDRYIKINLQQSFDFIEILSLKITQEDAYRTFCSDYGVIVGRVIINSGFGVPNAKVSVFIPIDEIDSSNSQIKGLYPYELITDKDSEGIRYNLLPKYSETNNPCFTPVGTFPSKREIIDNPDMLEIYNRYYKFTTTTNHAGDFMIFGVPLGMHTVHVDADISDIGILSQRPYDAISQGIPLKMFETSTKYKGGTNLDKLIQLKTANTGVNVQPFWGDKDTCEIGISRVDIDLNYNIVPSAIFMGNIFGDHEKNSVNKNCIPRSAMGRLCEQVSNEGTIEMIRETIDGDIESFDINGGRLIDENGSWAYQIPMNLDYMITDDTGDLVLSADPNKGIPTRANVRFRIGMDQTGGIGRLRTRAKYLVPHNPTNGKPDEIDYEFGDKTKKTSLRNIYWNKIYSVSNFISRYQRTSGVNPRRTSIKDVDGCGEKSPFPYNRVDISNSPLFFIICIIVKVFGFLVYVLNKWLIDAINFVITGINDVINAINHTIIRALNWLLPRRWEVDNIGTIGYIACVYIYCGGEDQKKDSYAPGCVGGDNPSHGFTALDTPPTYFPDDTHDNADTFGNLVGLDDCIAFQMAVSLDIFEFDFYNDWINGSLYGFLLKYKKRGSTEKFCDYECLTSPNDCHTVFIVDDFYGGAESSSKEYDYMRSVALSPNREGLIKKYDNEFYYAATTHDAVRKLFATELINLGSVFDCDWQGAPKIQPYLVETSYKLPPVTDELSDDDTTVLVTGQVTIAPDHKGLFFSINCDGLKSDPQQILNIRHICEYGVDLDEARPPKLADSIIGTSDIDSGDSDIPKFVRDAFFGLNIDHNSMNINLPFTTNFNTGDSATYSYVSTTDNGPDYVNFRGYVPNNTNEFNQPSNSYYFYFGIYPGKTGLNKLNQNFFPVCKPEVLKVFSVSIATVSTTYGVNNNGSATFTFFNGVKPINYIIIGPNNTKITGTVNSTDLFQTVNLFGLVTGGYLITATDSLNNQLSENFVISPAPALYADAIVTKNCTSITSPDGEITIIAVGGGDISSSGSYTYVLYNSTGQKIAGPTLFNQIPTVIGGLNTSGQPLFIPGHGFGSWGFTANATGGAESSSLSVTNNATTLTTMSNTKSNPLSVNENVAPTTNTYADMPNLSTYLNIGTYTLVISDGANNYVTIQNLLVNGASQLTLTSTVTNTLCARDITGSIILKPVGGSGPYTYVTTTTKGYKSTSSQLISLSADTYTSTVTDSYGNKDTLTTILKPTYTEIDIVAGSSTELAKQCYSDTYNIPFYIKTPYGAGANVYAEYNIDDIIDDNGDPVWETITLTFVDNNTPIILQVPVSFTSSIDGSITYNGINSRISIRVGDSTKTCYSNVIDILSSNIKLPQIPLNITTGDNLIQNSPYTVKFNFNISYTPEDIQSRGPFTVKYIVTGNSHGMSQDSDLNTTTIYNTKEVITGTVPYAGGYPATDCKVTVYIIDNVGCVSKTLIMNIDLPG